MNLTIREKVIPKVSLGAVAGLIFSICYFYSFKREVTLFILLGFLIGLAVGVSNRIYTTKKVLYAVSSGTLGGLLVVIVNNYFNLMEITTAYPIIPFLIISIFIAVGMGLVERSLIKLILRLIAVLLVNYLVYAILAFAILMTYGMGFGIAYREIPLYVAFIIAGALITLGIGVTDLFEKHVIFSKAFWATIGIAIFLLWFFRHWIMDILGFLHFLQLAGGYILPLIIPTFFFYKGVGKKKIQLHFFAVLMSLIFWFFWARFWFHKTYHFTAYKQWESAMFMCLIIVFISISAMHIYRCYILLRLKDDFSHRVIGKKILWQSWYINFITIIATICLYKILLNVPDYFLFGLSLPSLYDISDPIGLSLQWLILTLPATLKIDSILSRESKVSEIKK